MHRIQAEEQRRAQDQQQTYDRVHARIGATNHPAMAGVDMVEPDAQRHEDGEHRRGPQHHPLPSGRHEAHEVAGVRPKESQVRRQNRLVADLHLEVFDHRDDDRHGQQHRSGDPEPIGDHEQDHVDHADQDHVEYQHEVGAGEHLRDEIAQSDQRARQFHTRAGHRHAPLQDGHRGEVEHEEQHRVQPIGEWLAPTLGLRVGAFDVQFFDVGHTRSLTHFLHHGSVPAPSLTHTATIVGQGMRGFQANGRFLYDCFQTIR